MSYLTPKPPKWHPRSIALGIYLGCMGTAIAALILSRFI